MWDNDGVELDVVATRPLGNRPDLNRVNVRAKGGFKVHTVDADSLTHERPDSWERLEEDATIRPEAYCVKRGIDFSDVDGQHRVLDEVTERMARDLVRRAKALAGGA